MKKKYIGFLAVLALAAGVFANANSIETMALDFIAPTVDDVTNIHDPNAGLLVYDVNDDLIKMKSWGSGWQTLTNGFLNAPVTYTTTQTLVITEEIVLTDATSAAFTVTLPPASSSGKVFEIKKIDSSFNAVTVDGASAETIDGQATTTLNTQYESIRIVSDGSNWHIFTRNIPSTWTAYTPNIVAFGTETGVDFEWRRVGSDVQIRGEFTSGTPTGTEAQVPLPTGLTVAGSSVMADLTISGLYFRNQSADTSGAAILATGGDAFFNMGDPKTFSGTAIVARASANGSTILGSSQELGLEASIQVEGWKQ